MQNLLDSASSMIEEIETHFDRLLLTLQYAIG